MSRPGGPAAEERLAFFGTVTASVTHEIKNCLAIIDQVSGLLLDLSAPGRPLDPHRVEDLARRIGSQVARADRIVRRLNRFAHTADEPRRTLDLGELVETVVGVTHRLAEMRGLSLEARVPADPVTLTSSPALLAQAVFRLATSAFAAAAEGAAIRLTVEPRAGGARVAISGAPGGGTGPDPALDALLAALGARAEPGGTAILLPARMPPAGPGEAEDD